MERTRAHVGAAELSLEQWIRIALSYCPKPTQCDVAVLPEATQ